MAQRDVALLGANRIRLQRSALRQEVVSLGRLEGSVVLADAIESLPDWLAGADALTVIGWCPLVGPGRVEEFYARTGATQSYRLRELSPRQRAVIAACLREHGVGRRRAVVTEDAA